MREEWAYALWFALMISALQALVFMAVGRFGGPFFSTAFDETEIRCAIVGAVLMFPITLICYRYRPNGSGRP